MLNFMNCDLSFKPVPIPADSLPSPSTPIMDCHSSVGLLALLKPSMILVLGRDAYLVQLYVLSPMVHWFKGALEASVTCCLYWLYVITIHSGF